MAYSVSSTADMVISIALTSLVIMVLLCLGSDAQGLLGTEEYSNVAATAKQRSLGFGASYAAAQKAKLDYRLNTAASCSAKGATLCSPVDDADGANYAKLLIATSPMAYDSSQLTDTGGFSCIGPARDQKSCASCTSMAVVAAAEAAVACVSRVDGANVRMSEQDHYFCAPVSSTTFQRMCDSGCSLPEALRQLTDRVGANQLVKQTCLPYLPDPTMELTRPELCNYKCRDPDPLAQNGTFEVIPIGSYWVAQRHIRRYGSIVTRMNINMHDFRSFFLKNPTGVYNGQTPNVQPDTAHAVMCHAYDNAKFYWVCLNSWGPGFGMQGSFKVAYGKCDMMAAGETFGIQWSPKDKSKLISIVEPELKGDKGCYPYLAKPGESIALIAEKMWGRGLQPIQQLLRDNVNNLKDLDQNVAGITLKVCKPNSSVVMTNMDPRLFNGAMTKGPWGSCSASVLRAQAPHGVRFDGSGPQQVSKVSKVSNMDECCRLCAATDGCQLWSFVEYFEQLKCHMFHLKQGSINVSISWRASGGMITSGGNALVNKTSVCGDRGAWLLHGATFVLLDKDGTDPGFYITPQMAKQLRLQPGSKVKFQNGLVNNNWQECCKRAHELGITYWTYDVDKRCWLRVSPPWQGEMFTIKQAGTPGLISGIIGNSFIT